MVTVFLHPKNEDSIIEGSSWIFNTQIQQIEGSYKPGDIVEIRSSSKQFLGRGYINPEANIAVRVLTRFDEPVNKDFFIKRIRQAIYLRKKIISNDTDMYRLVFSESDFLPGLIVDVYQDYCVMQTLSLGMEKRKDIIIDILKEFLMPKGIYLRNDTPTRMKEGLLLEKKTVYGKFSRLIETRENGVKFLVDIENGQKTGFYLDRRQSRLFLKQNLKDKKVLDCFCYNGAFGVYANVNGAAHVTGIDISAHALKQAASNMRANRINSRRFKFTEGNVFDALKSFDNSKERFDLIVLDPPGFSVSKHKIAASLRAYSELNQKAISLLTKNGMLISSCSNSQLDDERFKQIVLESADKQKRIIRQLGWATQSSDHPGILNKKETLYFKCLFSEVI
jgi:23S rRNA (cytosine1962-C5)-methyltransferase